MSALEETERRIKSMRWAAECYESTEDQKAFAEKVMDLAGLTAKPVTVKVPEAMTDAQSIVFEMCEFPFGVDKGRRIKDVPLSYLVWLTEDRPQFVEELRRYLRSDRIQEELRRTEDDE